MLSSKAFARRRTFAIRALALLTLLVFLSTTPSLRAADDNDSSRPEKRTTLFDWPFARPDGGDKEESKRMPNDQPHFTDNSRVVGLGRVMIESGYTFTYDGSPAGQFRTHSTPEMLLRMGMFAEWFELRLEWNYLMTSNTLPGQAQRESIQGAEDMAVGMRLALTEQNRWLPESALNLSMSLPTGNVAFSANRMLPEVRYHYTWALIENKLELEANTIGYATLEPSGHQYMVFAQTANFEYELTDKAELFFEWYGLFPHGARGPDISPQQYFHTGVTYYFTDNFALFGHVATGLNRHADDFYCGAGVLARY